MLNIDQFQALEKQVGNMDTQMEVLLSIIHDSNAPMGDRRQAIKDYLRFDRARRDALSRASDIAKQ